MSKGRIARMIVDFGIAVYEAIRDGRTDKKIKDVLPSEYAAEIRLMELEAKAKEDYPESSDE